MWAARLPAPRSAVRTGAKWTPKTHPLVWSGCRTPSVLPPPTQGDAARGCLGTVTRFVVACASSRTGDAASPAGQPQHAQHPSSHTAAPGSAAGANGAAASAAARQPAPQQPPWNHGAAVLPVPEASETADLPYYSQYPLDRHAEWRRDEPRLKQLLAQPDARIIPIIKDKVLVAPCPAHAPTAPGAAPLLHPVTLSPASAHAASPDISDQPAQVFLGTDALGAPYFAAPVPSLDAAKRLAAAHPGAEWRSARLAGPDLAPGDAALLAVASGLMVWHGTNPYSPATGAPTLSRSAGFSRKCTQDGGSTYPRIDPAVIMLVTHAGQYGLLGRKPEWPRDRYSTLAGFLEVGEPMELAVVREVAEESAVRVSLPSVSYHASQPWPFPRSLMVGFTAATAPGPHPPSRPQPAHAPKPDPTTATTSPPASTSTGTDNGDMTPTGSLASSDGGGSVRQGGYSPPTSRLWWQRAAVGATGFDLLPQQGKRAALDVGVFAEEVEELLLPLQEMQWPAAEEDEMQDVRWFHRDWLRAVFRSPIGSAGVPGAGQFNIPGPYSLAYRLITSWVGTAPVAATNFISSSSSSNGASSGASPAAATNGSGAQGAQGDPWVGDAFPQVLISDSGVFKYTLMRLWDPAADAGGKSKLVAWGDTRAPYHNDILQKAKSLARQYGLKVTPLGGGRIRHDPAARSIDVYGYSAAFGPAPHELTAALLHKWYPLYDATAITVSYEGY